MRFKEKGKHWDHEYFIDIRKLVRRAVWNSQPIYINYSSTIFMMNHFSFILGRLWSREMIRYSYTSGGKIGILLLLWSLWFGTVPFWENSCYQGWMPMYQYYFAQNISRVVAPHSNSNLALVHTLTVVIHRADVLVCCILVHRYFL